MENKVYNIFLPMAIVMLSFYVSICSEDFRSCSKTDQLYTLIFSEYLAKKGPIYAIDWNPNSSQFCVVYGCICVLTVVIQCIVTIFYQIFLCKYFLLETPDLFGVITIYFINLSHFQSFMNVLNMLTRYAS